MGFDNECILNIQSLAGEYFCPVCRLLVYPNEALQSQCTHLYCKPCLTYIVSTTRACPYDGYLVTEADSKPLIESNKALAETIGKIAVHCLYHRSGCTWQGQLSECTTHCAECAFGNSPVVCNRCGTQIVHRQVQEHAQNCPGVQPQAQQEEGGQNATAASGTTVAAEQNHATSQAGALASQAQPTQSAAAPPPSQDQSQANINSQPQAVAQPVPTSEQWYQQQQQYQQYYQQYPGYDPYQQHYQHYDPYQQHTNQQYQQQHLQTNPPHVFQGTHQPQGFMQPQPQPQAQPQPQPQPQPQLQPQPQPQPQPQTQPQPQPHAHPQAPSATQPQVHAQVSPQQQLQQTVQPLPQMQPHPQMLPQTHPPSQGHHRPQLYPQAQPHPPQLQVQPHLQQRPHVPQHQQPLPQIQHPQPHSQPQLHPQRPPHMQPQPQPLPQPPLQGQHPPAQSVTGHQSYPQSQPLQQMLPVAPQQIPIHMHSQQQGAAHQLPQHTVQTQGQFPQQQPPQMRPTQSHVPMQPPQQLAMLPPQGQHTSMAPAQQQPVHPHAIQSGQPMHQHPGMHPPQQQPVPQQPVHGNLHHPHSFPGQTSGLVHNQSHQPGHFMQQQQLAMQPQLRPQGPPVSLQQHGHPQVQQNVPVAHGILPHQSQNHAGRPTMPSHGMVSHQPFQQSPGRPAHGKPMQSSATQPSLNQSYPPRTNIRPQSSSEQKLGYVQHSALPQSGSGTVLQPALPASQSETTIQASSMQTTMKSELEHVAASQKADLKEANGLLTTSSQGVELKIPRSESDLKSLDDEGKSVNENEGKSNQPNFDVKEISESSQALEKDTASLAPEDGSEDPVIKQMVKEEATSKSEPSTGEIAAKDQKDFPHHGPKQDGNSLQEDKEIQDHPVQKKFPSQQTEVLEGKDVKMQTDMADSQMARSGLDTGGPIKLFPGADRGSQAVSQSIGAVPGRTGQNVIPQGNVPRSERNNTLALPMHRDQFQQPPQQNLVPTHERMFPQPGYNERNLPQPQFPHHGAGQMQGNNFVQHGHVVSVPDNQQLPMHHGPHPQMQDRAHQRPLINDQMLQPSMPPPNQMQVPGQPPVHIRPPAHNFHGNLPPQGQTSITSSEHFRPPISKEHHVPFHPEVPPGGFIGVGSSASVGRGPSLLGPSHRGFEPQPSGPQGHHHQGHVLPAHASGPRIQSDPMGGPPLGGPHPGGFDSQGDMMARGPPRGSEGHIGPPRPTNPMDAEMFAKKRPGYVDGRRPDSHFPGSAEHVPSNIMEMSGGPGKGFTGGIQDPSFPFGSEERLKHLQEERYKQLREEGFNPQQGERFKSFSIERSRHNIDQRDFEEDLKQFPRPSHLDADHVPKFESYFSSSKSLDRAPHGFGHEVGMDGSAGTSRFLPPYQPGSLKPIGFRDDNMGRTIDRVGVHPDFLRSASESGRHRMDGPPLLRSPGREYPGIPSCRFGRLEDIDGRESRLFGERSKPFNPSSDVSAFHESRFPIFPNHSRRGELDSPGNLRSGDLAGPEIPPIHLRSEHLAPRNLSSHLPLGEPAGFGVFPNHLRVGERGGPGNLPSNLRIGESIGGNLPSHARIAEPGFSGNIPIHGYPNDSGFFNAGDAESFDHSRKRKPGSTGWCRICKVDCETIEGLDMHSQTREHQMMAMDMVLKIKKDNAKRQKVSLDDHISHEDANKSRKGSFDSREN